MDLVVAGRPGRMKVNDRKLIMLKKGDNTFIVDEISSITHNSGRSWRSICKCFSSFIDTEKGLGISYQSLSSKFCF